MSKTILITGATAGFGRACAVRFAEQGWRLILTGRRRERLEEFRHDHPDVSIHCAAFDIRDRSAITSFVRELPPSFSSVDVLVNNAGLALGLEPAHLADLDDWQTMIDTNITGLVTMTRLLLPAMVERDQGHIINLGSVAGTYPYPGGNVYGASKAFVRQFSRNLLADLVQTGIRVTNIEPGLAKSEFSLVRFHGDQEKADQVYRDTRPLTPEDIAEIVFWVTTMPEHVNINTVEVMPVCQGCGPFVIHRQTEDR